MPQEYACPISKCGYLTKRRSNLSRHLKPDTVCGRSKAVINWVCQACQCTCMTLEDYRAHHDSIHARGSKSSKTIQETLQYHDVASRIRATDAPATQGVGEESNTEEDEFVPAGATDAPATQRVGEESNTEEDEFVPAGATDALATHGVGEGGTGALLENVDGDDEEYTVMTGLSELFDRLNHGPGVEEQSPANLLLNNECPQEENIAEPVLYEQEVENEYDCMSGEVDDDECSDDDDNGTYESSSLSSFTSEEFLMKLKEHPTMRKRINLLRFVVRSRMTHSIYREMMEEEWMRDLDWAPKNLTNLERSVKKFMGQWLPIHKLFVNEMDSEGNVIDTNAAAFLEMLDIVSLMLSDPLNREQVIDGNDQLPLHLMGNKEALKAFACQRRQEIDSNSRTFKSFLDGFEVLDNLVENHDIMLANFKLAKELGIPIYILHLLLYEDDFVRAMNSRVKQSIFQVSLLEALQAGAKVENFANIIAMLADAEGTKGQHGDDPYYTAYTAQVKLLGKGQRMKVAGNDAMVFALPLAFVGDTPAIKKLMGLSPSTNAVRPCRYCMIHRTDIENRNVATAAPDRDPNQIKVFLDRNNNKSGRPEDPALIEALHEWGALRCPEIGKWHNQGNCYRLLLDGMHMFNLGLDAVVCQHTVSVMTEDADISSSIYKRLSELFRNASNHMRMSAFTNFSSAEEFEKKLTAKSMKDFVQLLPHFLIDLGLVQPVPESQARSIQQKWKRKKACFDYLCMYVKLQQVFYSRTISPSMMTMLDTIIPLLLQYWRTTIPHILTLNAHYLVHLVQLIRMFGPPRVWANFLREGYIGRIKKFYANINNRAVEVSVLTKYVMQCVLLMVDMQLGVDKRENSRDLMPACVMPFSKYNLYNKIIVQETHADGFRLFDHETGYDSPHLQFCYNNLANVKTIINWDHIQTGDFIFIDRSHAFDRLHLGVFVTVLFDVEEDSYYISYQVPLSVDNSTGHSYLNRKLISKRCRRDLYIVPISLFIRKAVTCPILDKPQYSVIC